MPDVNNGRQTDLRLAFCDRPFTSYPICAVVLAPMARSVGVLSSIFFFVFSGGTVRLGQGITVAPHSLI